MDASAQVTFSFLSTLLFSLGSWHMGECSHSQIESSSSVAGVSGNILLTHPDMWCFSDFGTSQADRADQPSEFLLWRWIFWEKPVSSFMVAIINESHQAQLSTLEVIAVQTCILLDPAVLHPRIVCHTGASESSDALKWKRHLFRQEFQKATVTNVEQRKICFFFSIACHLYTWKHLMAGPPRTLGTYYQHVGWVTQHNTPGSPSKGNKVGMSKGYQHLRAPYNCSQ